MATSYIYNELTGEFEEREIIPPRIKYFRLRNRKAFLDKPCTIEWEVENASSVSLERVGPQNATGFFTYRPNGNSQWVLRARGEGEVTQTLEVEAYPLPKINSFTAQPEQEEFPYFVGDKVSLEWDASNFDSIELNGEDVSNSQSKIVEIQAEDTDFSLVVISEEQRDDKSIHIHSYKCPSITFTTDKKRLRKEKNETFTLEWSVKDAVSVSVYDNAGNIISNETKGQIIRFSDNGTKFSLEAIGLDGKRVFKEQISLEVHNASIVTFKADKLFTLPGVPVTLTWDVQHAESVELSDVGDVPPHGTHKIEPTTDTIATLKVKDKFGVTNYRQEIKMLPLPVVTLNPPTPAYKTMVTLVQPKTFVKLSVSLPQVPIGAMPSRIQGINFSLSPAFVTPTFALKRESMWHGIKDITCHLTKSFLNKFNKTSSHE